MPERALTSVTLRLQDSNKRLWCNAYRYFARQT